MPAPAPKIQNNPIFNNLFKTPTPTMSLNQFLTKGSLIVFKYSFWMHDPYPLVIVSDFAFGNKVRGVNLHYLTYPVISSILSSVCTTKSFSYTNIKGNAYISGAFRTYRWNGIAQVKKLDCNLILRVMSGVRQMDPSQTQAIRQSIEDQLSRPTNSSLDQNQGITPTVGQVPTTPTAPVAGQNSQNQQSQNGALNGG